MKFYAVQKGRKPGVYSNWESCEAQVKGFPGAKFKSFPTKAEAESFVAGTWVQTHFIPNNESTESPTSSSVQIWVDGACIHNDGESMQLG